MATMIHRRLIHCCWCFRLKWLILLISLWLSTMISATSPSIPLKVKSNNISTLPLPATNTIPMIRGGAKKSLLLVEAAVAQPETTNASSKTKNSSSINHKTIDTGKVKRKKTLAPSLLSKIDFGVFGIYFCTSVTMTLPVLLVPMMDAELLPPETKQLGVVMKTSQSLAAMVASMAPMGGGIGKLVNGFVCQALGPSRSSKIYFLGSTLSSLALASTCISLAAEAATQQSSTNAFLNNVLTQNYLGWIIASIEFCASIQWTVCSSFLALYYKDSPALFVRGVTILSLASTTGQIVSKFGGAILLQYFHWRKVARVSVGIALLGFCISTWTSFNMSMSSSQATTAAAVAMANSSNKTTKTPTPAKPPTIGYAIPRVLGSRMFWLIGLAHISGYLTRTSDRVLGSFLQEITALSRKYIDMTD